MNEEKYLAIINSSGWPPTKMLTPQNKAEFLSGLIQQELVVKRECAILAFGRGLELLKMLSIIRHHDVELRDAFVYNCTKKLTAETLISLIHAKPPIGRKRRRTYYWFLDYIRDRDSVGMA